MNYIGTTDHHFIKLQAENKPGSIAKKKLTKLEEKLSKYNNKIINYMDKIKHKLHLVNFYQCYKNDPLKFMQNYLLQQNGLLKIIKNENTSIESNNIPMKNKEAVIEKYIEENTKKQENVESHKD